ncbi:MAG: nucleotidyl transferase AbiEii/AbiGii toxin family protein [Pseudomonadales bacterium]|nr:nucleotidyl transferase AbiEii/AbiGii toxin family protein [Pseudomonadales bacterium]
MVNRDELLALADATGLAAPVVEKDYVLGWILRGIYQQATLQDGWVFKGGTCLKKCYFETYRFSEDLDFTLRNEGHLDETFLQETFREIAQSIYDESGLELRADRTRFELYQNPRGKTSGQGRLYYRSQFQTGNNFPAVKLDLTTDEILVDEAVRRQVSHPYSDEPEGGFTALCYSYEEVFAEKLRALGERTRARDLYDVVHLHRNSEYEHAPGRVREILARKCEFKEIGLVTLDVVRVGQEIVVATWKGMLAHQLPQLPPFDSFWSELPAVFAWLESGATRPVLTPAPVDAGTEILRPRFGGLVGLIPNASIMERIRFAAQSRLLVELNYVRLDGQPRRPTIEPYSLRRSQAGEISLAGFDAQDGHIKMYRVDRIQGARVLDRVFVPRYAIELSPLGTATRRA